MLKALVVDDEAPARSELRYLLDEAGGVEVVGEASNAAEAQQLIKAIPYDVIFLDAFGRESVPTALTTEEFLNEAQKSAELTGAHRTLLSTFLEHCDRVKFAQYHPEQAEKSGKAQEKKR